MGIAIDQVDKVIHCNASKFEIPGKIEMRFFEREREGDLMQKFMQILATLALLLVLALVIPLTLARPAAATRTEDTSYPRPESGSPMAERVMNDHNRKN